MNPPSAKICDRTCLVLAHSAQAIKCWFCAGVAI
jgi:hypothetical protein